MLIKGYNFKFSTKLANLQEDEVEGVVPIQHRLMEVVEVVGKAMEEGVVAVALVDQAFLDVHVQEVQEAFRAFLKTNDVFMYYVRIFFREINFPKFHETKVMV